MAQRFTDMLGSAVVLEHVPSRIVSLVPSQTELLYDLGLEDEVVGITKFCIHPESWFRTKTRVGGTKQVHLEQVAALKPDLILANKEENVKEQIEALRAIAPVWVSDIQDLEGALTMIKAVGAMTGRAEKAGQLAVHIEQDFAALAQASTPLNVAYGIWRNPWMWAGGDTFISNILEKIGWSNALKQVPRYPEVPLADLKQYEPNLVLLSSEPYPFKEKHIAEIREVLPAAKICLVDGELFSWYGSRLLYACAYLKSLILAVHE